MTDTNIPTSEVLYRAADLIAFHGLAHGSLAWQSSEAGICTEGAIAAAANLPMIAFSDGLMGPNVSDLTSCPAYRAVSRHVDRPSLWRWNDESNYRGEYLRTAAEVIEVLRAAAVIEAAKERADVSEVVAR